MLNDPTLPEDHPINRLNPAVFARNEPGKYAAKLQFSDRCAILALFKSNIARPVLALAFGVDRRTVNHIVSDASPHYKDVKREALRLGDAEFRRIYVREADISRVNAARTAPEAAETYAAVDQKNSLAASGGNARSPNRRASSHRGIYNVPLQRGVTHRIEINWLDAEFTEPGSTEIERPVGWYWRDLNDGFPEWLGCDEGKPAHTSSECLRWVEQNAY